MILSDYAMQTRGTWQNELSKAPQGTFIIIAVQIRGVGSVRPRSGRTVVHEETIANQDGVISHYRPLFRQNVCRRRGTVPDSVQPTSVPFGLHKRAVEKEFKRAF